MEKEPAGRERLESPTTSNFMRERLWLVVSIALLASAAVLLWLGHTSAAFVAAALGVCAWFLDVRTGLKRRHDLVKLSGRNWVPRDELEELEDEGGEGGED
jgi:Flp pilus assembly protein TadB